MSPHLVPLGVFSRYVMRFITSKTKSIFNSQEFFSTSINPYQDLNVIEKQHIITPLRIFAIFYLCAIYFLKHSFLSNRTKCSLVMKLVFLFEFFFLLCKCWLDNYIWMIIYALQLETNEEHFSGN